jgi:Putative zinc-finger
MTDCDFTERVSLLVDGELEPHEAARLRAHVEACAACGQARDAFLLLRQELRSYEWAPDARIQSKALASILGSRTSGVGNAAPSAGVWAGRRATPRGRVSGLWGSLAEAFSVRSLRPAHVAALALLLIGIALGVRWFMGSHTPSLTQHSDAPASANANSQPVQTATRTEDEGKRQENSDTVDSPTVFQAKTQKPSRAARVGQNVREGRENVQPGRDGYRTGLQRREGLSHELPRELARIGEPASPPSSASLLPSAASAVALYAAGSLRAEAAADDPSQRIGRHAGRVERLLRSFRNARLTESDPTLDVADARRLSKRLLYSNIALRREAASAGDLPVEGLLDSVEPILLDISNLPNAPSPAAVGSIKERINRRQLVGALQAQGMLASR